MLQYGDRDEAFRTGLPIHCDSAAAVRLFTPHALEHPLFSVNPMRSTLLAVTALAFLRIVVGMHFFLEGLSHLRDPDWSSAGFRKAAVGPLADFFRASLPETGNWCGNTPGRMAQWDIPLLFTTIKLFMLRVRRRFINWTLSLVKNSGKRTLAVNRSRLLL
jgi:hypothetical protein